MRTFLIIMLLLVVSVPVCGQRSPRYNPYLPFADAVRIRDAMEILNDGVCYHTPDGHIVFNRQRAIALGYNVWDIPDPPRFCHPCAHVSRGWYGHVHTPECYYNAYWNCPVRIWYRKQYMWKCMIYGY